MPYTSAQLVAAYTAANNGVAPDAATSALLAAFATQTQTGQLSDASALAYVINSAQDDVQVAVQAYQFFTGKTPTKAGLDYLVNSSTNTNDLNDAYYSQFNLENRYINFAVNLGIVGEGAANFATTYGSLSFSQFVGVAYETIIGSSYAQAAGINVAAAIADVSSRQANFTAIARQAGVINNSSTTAQVDLATKAALIGYLMAEGVKADVGLYAAGANNFVNALVQGTAQYNVNLTTVYSPQGGGVGQAVGGQGATPGGTTLTLTTGTDALVGTSGNDTVTGALNIGTPALSTLSLGDSIQGGAGTDTLNVVTNGASADVLAGISLNSVEVVNVNNASAAGNVAVLNAASVPGMTAAGVIGAGDVTVTNIPTGASLNIQGYTAAQTQAIIAAGARTINATAVSATTGNAINVTVSGAATAATALTVNNGGTGAATLGTLTIENATTALTVNATSALTFANITSPGGTGLQTVVVAGSAVNATTNNATSTARAVTLGTLGQASLTSVDASGLTSGGVAVGIGANVATTFKGGQGNDTVTIARGVAMTGTVDAGAGTADILAISTGDVSGGAATADTSLTAATKALFTNFEILRVAAVATGAGGAAIVAGDPGVVAADVVTFNADNVPAGITQFQIGASTAGVTINNLAANPTVTQVGTFSAAAGAAGGASIVPGVILNLKDATGLADTVTYAMNNLNTTTGAAGLTVNTLSAPGVETLNIQSAGIISAAGAVNTITSLTPDASLSTVNITGSAGLSLTTGNLTKSVTINGSAATGQLTINAGATATAATATNINGGTSNDTITAGISAGTNQSINGGGGGDSITLGGARDTLVFKAGTDSTYDVTGTVGASLTGTLNTGKMDVVTGFATGTDKIDVTSFSLSAQQLGIADKGTVATTDALLTLANTAGFFVDAATVQRAVAEVHVGVDTYLFVDVNKDGVFQAASDLAVRFVGTALIANGDLIGS